ncbi:unnamed protein product [Lampetra planeri]
MQTRWAVALLLVLLAVAAAAGKKDKRGEKKAKKLDSDCEKWKWGACVPNQLDCGPGTRGGTRGGAECKQTSKTLQCKIPCNWKKPFGADCKYRWQNWGECDATTKMKTRQGALKKAIFNAECQQEVTVSKPCGKRGKSKAKGEGRGHRWRNAVGHSTNGSCVSSFEIWRVQ